MRHRNEIIDELSSSATIVAISKNRSRNEIESLFQDGISIFGENRVNELKSKSRFDDQWQWHFVGHLQTNKVKDVVSICTMIQSVDSIHLLKVIEHHCEKLKKSIDILIQVNVSQEKSKFGCSIHDLDQLIAVASASPFVNLKGLMVIGPLTSIRQEIELVFQESFAIFCKMKSVNPEISILSMGMSNDFELALANGSTMLRLGSYLFESFSQKMPIHNK